METTNRIKLIGAAALLLLALPAAAYTPNPEEEYPLPRIPTAEIQKLIRTRLEASLPAWDKRLLISYETRSWEDNLHYQHLNKLLGESTGNRLVIDLMKHPKIGKNKAVRRMLGLVSSVVTVHGVESDDGHLDVLLRAFPRGVGGAMRAVRDHMFTDGPTWIRGMLPGRRGVKRCANARLSMPLTVLSIHPKQSASSTASL